MRVGASGGCVVCVGAGAGMAASVGWAAVSTAGGAGAARACCGTGAAAGSTTAAGSGSATARGGLVLDEAHATPAAGWTATWRSYLVILCLEIGDRTFFIAALLAGKHPGTTVFVGAFGASSFVLVCARSVLLTPRHSDVYSAQSMQARCL